MDSNTAREETQDVESDAPNLRFDESEIPGSYKYTHACFRDCNRRIDFVLSYIEGKEGKQIKREEFEKGLKEAGLQLETERTMGKKKGLYFVKLHVPDDVLKLNAEILDMKLVYTQEYEYERRHNLFRLLRFMENDVKTPTRVLRTSFLGDSDEVNLIPNFSDVDRITVVWNILKRTKFGPGRTQFGISRLLSSSVYTAAFPLHEGTALEDPPSGKQSTRRVLYTKWASLRLAFYKQQPLDMVREYFGEEVALYFNWVGCYTQMLFVAALVGIFVFLYGVCTSDTNDMIPSKEICSSDLILCPACNNPKRCNFIHLRDSCLYSELSYMFDNPVTVFFAVFMSFWGTVFMELWKREQAVQSWRWDLSSVQLDEEPRPDYEIKAKREQYNPITRRVEPYVPLKERLVRYLVTAVGILLMAAAALGTFFGLALCSISIRIVMADSPNYTVRKYKAIFSTITMTCVSVVAMMIFQVVFVRFAIFLTNLENPRTQSEYEDSYTFKVFTFEFINFYAGLVYTAFFKGKFFTHPADKRMWTRVHGLDADLCDPAGCLSDVFMQLAIIMMGKQVYFNILEHVKPRVLNWWKGFKATGTVNMKMPRWERDYNLTVFTSTSLFSEQLEMVIQYGFVTLFVSAFPLAPVIAFINNIFEIRIDAYKLLVSTRRSLPRKVRGLGAWDGILQGITYLAVVFNAIIIAFTSDFVPRIVYKIRNNWDLTGYVNFSLSVFDTKDYGLGELAYETCRYRGYREPPSSERKYKYSVDHWYILATEFIFVVVFEHLILLLVGILAYVIPDIPRFVKQQMAVERAEAREARKKVILASQK